MKQCLIPLEDETGWAEALEGVPHAFAHRNDHCRAFAASSGLPTHLYAAEFDGVRVACPLSVRTFMGERDVVTPYGFAGFTSSGPAPGFAGVWRQFAAAQGWVCGYLQNNPLLPDPLSEEPGEEATELFVLDLSRSDQDLLSAMSPSRRRQLRRGDDFAIGPAGPGAVEFLIEEGAEFFETRQASSIYRFCETTWRGIMASEALTALEARRDGAIVAVTLLGAAGGVGDYLFNVSRPGGQEASAPLLWQGVLRLKGAGVRWLNLGGGIRPGDAVAEFKRRFGAATAPMVVRKQVYRPEAFGRLCAKAGVEANAEPGYFPSYYASGRR